jgi:ABC-type dipeptide/oligopeptide/nickel transport system ATPase component
VLTDLLDEYREAEQAKTERVEQREILIPQVVREKCLAFLKRKNLLQSINELIGKSGVVGEENNRIFLFGIASSYKMYDTLHALIQGSSGSGKTHLLATIMDFMPPEDTISLTRVTESSFYNYGKYELQNKLIGMEDYDGLEEKAELAFRELQSKGMISSSTSGKNENTGEISGFIKEVYGPIASLSATTKGEVYEDNMSRCFLVAVDESQEQTLRIIKHQNNRAAGLVNKQKEKEIREFLRNCMRLLNPHEVVNPFANKIELPKEAHKIRRLNDLFQCYVKQVTTINQYQRQKDNQGRLITQKEDVGTAIEIMFDSIILKVDELDGSLRLFYEELKAYVLLKSKEYEFTRREIRHKTKTSNTQLHRFMKQLLDLEYIYQSSGYDNRGHKYKIAYWDNMEASRERIKQDLYNQLEKL